jgi:hypothetical protein
MGNAYCFIFYYVGYVFYGTSMWMVVVVAVDRFVVVRFPLHSASWCTMRRARILTWVNFLIHALTSGVNFLKRPTKGGGQILACALPNALRWFELAKAILNIFAPLVVICLLNIVIIISLQLHDRKMQKLKASTTANPGNKDRGMTVMLILVATFLIVLNLPRVVDKLIWSYLPHDLVLKLTNIRLLSGIAVYLLSMTNNSINFFLYCFGSKYFRRDLYALLLCKSDETKQGGSYQSRRRQ